MLNIKNLHAAVEGNAILKGINLNVKAGEVHAIMGPNGSGKSSLASVLAGREAYEVTEGSVDFDGKDLLDMSPEVRAREGLFPCLPVPGRNTRRFQHQLPQNSGERDPRLPRPAPDASQSVPGHAEVQTKADGI